MSLAFPKCAASGCSRRVLCRGLCGLHYSRMRRGRALDDDGRRSVDERFFSRVHMTDGCWVWTGLHDHTRYGRFTVKKGRTVPAHRFAYEQLVGSIPDGLQIDHLCRNRSCVNPAHLEPVTQRENLMRGFGRSALQARQTHCIHGHPFDAANTYLYKGSKRMCRACGLARQRAKAAQKRARTAS